MFVIFVLSLHLINSLIHLYLLLFIFFGIHFIFANVIEWFDHDYFYIRGHTCYDQLINFQIIDSSFIEPIPQSQLSR